MERGKETEDKKEKETDQKNKKEQRRGTVEQIKKRRKELSQLTGIPLSASTEADTLSADPFLQSPSPPAVTPVAKEESSVLDQLQQDSSHQHSHSHTVSHSPTDLRILQQHTPDTSKMPALIPSPRLRRRGEDANDQGSPPPAKPWPRSTPPSTTSSSCPFLELAEVPAPLPPSGRRRKKVCSAHLVSPLRTAVVIACRTLWTIVEFFWAWKFVISAIPISLWFVGIAMLTSEFLRESFKGLCGTWVGHPILMAFGSSHICIPPPELPRDPFGTERVASFVTVYMPQIGVVPEDLADKKLTTAKTRAMIHANQELMFPNHGKVMVDLAHTIHDQLGICWSQSVTLRATSLAQMTRFTYKMRQTASETMQAVDEVEQRSQLVTILVEVSSRAFSFAMPYTKHYKIIEAFVFHIEDMLPQLVRIIQAAEVLYQSLEKAKSNVLSLDYYLTLEQRDLEQRCISYSRWRRPSECGKWNGRYNDSISRLKALEDVMSETADVLQKSLEQLVNAKAHIESTHFLLLSAQSTLDSRWDVKMLLPEVKNIVQASENFERLVIQRGNYTVVNDGS